MKTRLKFLIVFALLMAFLGSQHAEASAVTYRFRSEAAQANLWSMDGSGCVSTWVWVLTGEQIYHSSKGSPNAYPEVSVYLDQHNSCTNTGFRAYGNETLSRSNLKIDGGLNSATLTATLDLIDLDSQDVIPVTINLTWVATSRIHSEISHNHINFNGYHVSTQIQADFRYAQVSGTISDGITNYTPDASGDASIYNAKHGEVIIGEYPMIP